MDSRDFIKIFKESFLDLIKNPVIVIPSVLLWVFLILFSKISVKINYSLNNTITITSWLVFFAFICLIAISFLFSALIGMSIESIKGRNPVKSSLRYAKKFWLKNFFIVLFNVAISFAAIFGLGSSAVFLGKIFGLGSSAASLLIFIFIVGIGLMGVIIFFTFSNFFLIIYNKKVKDSIKSSCIFVKDNYLSVLSTILIFFVLEGIISWTPNIIQEVIDAVFITPYLSLVLARFLIKSSKD